MKAYFFALSLLLILAELLSLFWFVQSKGELAGIVGKNEVRRFDLKNQRSGELLSFDEGVSYVSERGGKVDVSVLTWHEGNPCGLMDAFGHSPEVCLPLSGARLLEELPTRELRIGEKAFRVDCWVFSHPLFDTRLHAYKMAHSAHPRLAGMAARGELAGVRLLLFRQRSLMPSVEIAVGMVQGTDDPEKAWKRFTQFSQETFSLKKN